MWQFTLNLQPTINIHTHFTIYTQCILNTPCTISRKKEDLGRSDSIESLKKVITKYSDIAKNVNTKDEDKYSHLTDEQRKEVVDKCDESRTWLMDLIAAQTAGGNKVEPVLTMSMMKEKRKHVKFICSPIVNTPKPKPVEPEAAADAEAPADGAEKKDEEVRVRLITW